MKTKHDCRVWYLPDVTCVAYGPPQWASRCVWIIPGTYNEVRDAIYS
jgi:hypothetical protein